jgi:diadenosine tetraphosphate (Ap4A) HIT family hydrolase
MNAAKALKEVTCAAKINYEIHGNTVPHLNIHLFPRYFKGDRFRDGFINPRDIEPAVYKEDEFEFLVEGLREVLQSIQS